MRLTTFPLFLLPLLAASQSLSSQQTESSSETTTPHPLITAQPPSPLELRAQPPAAPAVPAPVVPAPVVPAPVVPAPAAPAVPANPAGGAGAGAPAGASPEGGQVPTITTVSLDTVVGGVPTRTAIVFTQTFVNIPSQGPTPEKGTIGLGTLKGSLKATGTGKGKRWLI